MESGTLTDSLSETLALFDGSGEPRTTTELAEELGLGRRSTYDRLERLVERDRLRTKKVGANARVWWRPRPDDAARSDWPRTAESFIDDVLDDVAVGVFVLDASFDVAWINETAEEYFGLERSAAVGRDKRELVPDRIAPTVEETEAFAETVLGTYEDNADSEYFECHLEGGEDREERWLEHRSQPIESGAYEGGRVELYYDVTDRKRTAAKREDDRTAFESLVEAVDEYAIFTLDTDGYVRTWNPGARRIKGYDRDEIVGEHFSQFYTDEEREGDVPSRNLAAAAKEGSVEDEGWRVRADGSRFWANVTITAIRDDDGDLQGFAKVTRDMTERREYERRLRRERDFNRQVLETAPASIFVLDRDGDVVTANDRFEEQLGMDGDSVDAAIGDLELYDEDGEPVPPRRRPYYRVFETGEGVSDWKGKVELADGSEKWLTINVAPIAEDGSDVDRVVVAAQDVTRMHRQEQQLRRQRDELQAELDDVFARIDDGFFALDDDWRFVHVNDRAEQVLDRSAGELIGQDIWEAFPEAAASSFGEQYERAMETQESVSFEEYYPPLETWFRMNAYPSEQGLSVYFRDVSDRKERERRLEETRSRYRTLIEHFPNGAVALVDRDLRYQAVGGTPVDDEGTGPEDLEGSRVGEILSPELADLLVPRYEAALEGEETSFEGEVDDGIYQFYVVPVRDDDGNVFAAMGMSQDVTERKEYERHLRDAKAQLEAATEAGAVGTFEWHVQEDRLVAGPAFARKFGLDPEDVREGLPLEQFVERIHAEDRPRVEEKIEAALESCGEYVAEYRVRGAEGDSRWVVARGDVDCDEDGQPVAFPGAVTDITERKEAELELERQRQQLAAMNHLNRVVRETTEAVIERSTREEIEATVCEHLAASDSYTFAWIGEADPATDTVQARTEAGVSGYLDDVTVSIDPGDDRSQGPTGRAVRTGEMQVANDIAAGDDHEPWREHVEQFEFRSSAAVPIVHEETIYGVLNVYADRTDAFQGRERTVLEQLGEIVGHAIAAVERKRALMSDEVVELAFQVENVFESMDVPVAAEGPIRLEHTAQVGDGEFVLFGTTTPAAIDAVEAIAEAVPFYEDVTVRESGDDVRFEFRVTEPPVLSTIASIGGSVEQAVIEDGDFRLTVHVSPSADVRGVIDAVTDAYPSATLLKRRQLTSEDVGTDSPARSFLADLTDRQRATIEAAYHAGFFEWPRTASGEEVADSLGVASPTFHQHLRKAERKVFESLLSGDSE